MGFAGNSEPQHIMPSAIAIKESASVGDKASKRLGTGVEDLNFFIGDEALSATGYSIKVSLSQWLLEVILQHTQYFYIQFLFEHFMMRYIISWAKKQKMFYNIISQWHLHSKVYVYGKVKLRL